MIKFLNPSATLLSILMDILLKISLTKTLFESVVISQGNQREERIFLVFLDLLIDLF